MARFSTTWLLAIPALGGCNQVFGIDQTDLVESIDTDGDGRFDLEDNCPSVPNPPQVDFDSDGAGDACDNCPLYANALQQNEGEIDGDPDEVGDDCDPNPTRGGDCLILLDQFTNPAELAANWELVSRAGEPAPTLLDVGDHVELGPNTNKPAFMVARVNDARLLGRFSVSLVGDWNPPGTFAEAMAATDVTSVDQYLACGVQKVSADIAATFIRFQVSATTSQIQGGFISGPPVRSDFSTRLVVERGAMDVARCSVKWGVADGVTTTDNPLAALPEGGAGVLATTDRVAIRAVAFYATLASCPPPLLR